MRPFFFLGILILFSSCEKGPPPLQEVKRPVDNWIMRSVLDNRPRMLSLALDTGVYMAYDLENMEVYKEWQGGIHWHGAAYTNQKNIQPESWGYTHYENTSKKSAWFIRKQNLNIPAKVLFGGYRVKKGHILIDYTLYNQEGDTLWVTERPEIQRHEKGEIIYFRHFEVKKSERDLAIAHETESHKWYDSQTYSGSGIQFKYQEKIEKPNQTASYDHLGRIWLDRSGCNTCHEMEEKTIGPSYKQISSSYSDTEENFTKLIEKVKKGGSGVWGEVPMNPHPNLEAEEIRTMLSYIFTLAEQKVNIRKKKAVPSFGTIPGFGAPLEAVHPSLEVQRIRPWGFKPRVGGMDMDEQGRLYISTWDSIGAVYRLEGIKTGDKTKVKVSKIASGLHEPLGLKIVDGDIFVMQKSELSQLQDEDGDGIIDSYKSFCNSFNSSADFHEYNYGLEYKDGYFYANLGIAMRMMSHQRQHPDRGTSIKIAADGSFETMMTGLRQPNGIGLGPEGEIVLTENQGRWVPACKLIVLQAGTFQGCKKDQGDRFDHLTPAPPAVWMPQHEIGNSPGQPILIPEGMYKDQLLVGEVTHGGLKRIFLEKVGGKWQGVIFRFSQGLEAGINRMVYGPEGALYVGGVGMNGNWGWQGKQFGLQRLIPSGKTAFEMLRVRAKTGGFEIDFTEALDENKLPKNTDILIKQWRYEATENYGGPKIDEHSLNISSIDFSTDRKSMNLSIPHLKEGYVVYIRLPQHMQSKSGKALWTGEAWYTLNNTPQN